MEASPQPVSRRSRKKARTRCEIYDAALQLFELRGFDGVTIEEICEEADVARATFFLHFPSKASLLYEFSNRVAADFQLRRGGSLGNAGGELRALVDFMIEKLVARADVMRAMLREFWSTPSTLEAAQKGGRDFPDLIEALIRRGQAAGEFREGVDARLASAVLLSTAGSILSGAVFREGELGVDEIRRQFFEVIFHGLVTEGGATTPLNSPQLTGAS